MWRIVIGNSMKPTKNFISLINLKKQENYHIGDIVVFKAKNGSRYCHRIIKINDVVFTTKGDNKKFSKEYETDIPIENIEGKDYC